MNILLSSPLIRLLPLVCLQTLPLTLQASEGQPLAIQAKSEIKTLAVALKSTLQHGMKTNGPAASVTLCNVQAPAITQASAAKSGSSDWTVTRTSLKLRSPANAPVGWIEEVLKDFEVRKNQGEAVEKMAHAETRNGQFYFIKAIPTQGACLVCHGSNVGAEVEAKLADLYPDDQATGYNIGDVRGAFIASKPVNNK
jgi:hypothetical protein